MKALELLALFVFIPFLPPYLVARLQPGQGDISAAIVVALSAMLPILVLFVFTRGDSINNAALLIIGPAFWFFCLFPAGIGRTIGKWQAHRDRR